MQHYIGVLANEPHAGSEADSEEPYLFVLNVQEAKQELKKIFVHSAHLLHRSIISRAARCDC
jgi:hypothetical protein